LDLSEKELKAILEALTTAHTYLYKDWTSECEFPALSEKKYNDLISRFENNILTSAKGRLSETTKYNSRVLL
jgi:hypothetical protein